MPSILSKSDFRTEWQRFQATHPKLLKDLRDPQLDAMFWLTMGKHVVLCVGTGCGKTLPFLCITALRSTCKHTFFILLLGKPLLLSGGISLLVAPLVLAIENQCREVCSTWEIPSLSLGETKAGRQREETSCGDYDQHQGVTRGGAGRFEMPPLE